MASASVSTFKLFRRKLADEFAAHLVISTCVEITVNYPREGMAEVYGNVIAIYHKRLMDQELHPRQSNWSNQFIIETFSMFKTQQEWTEFSTLPINSGQNLGKKTPANVGIAVPYVVWAKAIWAKWTRMRSHIVNVVNVDFKTLLTTKGRPKSGVQTIDVIEQLRCKYFDEWCTTTAGVVTHLQRPITECPDWVPGAWWHSWIALGPPQGEKAAAPLMAVEDHCPLRDDDEVPRAISDLLTSQFEGRKVQREMLQKRVTSETASAAVPPTSSSRKVDTHTPIKTFEAHLKEREAMMTRLNQLIDFPGMTPAKVEGYRKELLALMMKPIVSLESCGSPPFLPNFSSNTVTDDDHTPSQVVPVNLADSFEAAQALSLTDCIRAGEQVEVLTSPAALQFASEKLGQIHLKTTSFHSMTVPKKAAHIEPLFQMRTKPSDDSGSFNFVAQRKLHLDAGFDPNFLRDNDDYVILSRLDVLKHQPLFLDNFKKQFNVHFEDANIETNFSQCLPRDTLFFVFATLVNDRSRRIRDDFMNPNDDNGWLPETCPFQTIESMRTSLFRHIKGHHGNIPGTTFKFLDERSYVLDFNGDLSEYVSDTDRGGDPLFIHAFCHKFEFDVLLFSVKDPGGTLYVNQEHGNIDVCSILQEVNVDSVDKFYLAVPGIGGVATESFSSSFLNTEGSGISITAANANDVKEAKEKLDCAYAFLLQVRSDIVQSDSNIRYRNNEVNQRIRKENEEKLVAADSAYMMARGIAERLGINPSPVRGAVLIVPGDPTPMLIYDVRSDVHGTLHTPLLTQCDGGLDEFEEYRRFYNELPEWTVDIEIAFVSDEIGRGIRTLRPFKKGSVLGHYGGHRCDNCGKVIIRDRETDALFAQFANLNLDREKSGAAFQKSHALCLGQTHLSGLVIDGGPLCDPCLDQVRDKRGAFAAANSAASASAANAKPIWCKSPHFIADKINNLSDRVCFFIAKRDIE